MKLYIPLTIAMILASPAQAEDATYNADTVLAEVAGEKITLGHVVAMRSRLPQQYRDLPDNVLFSGILDQLIDQTIISQHVTSQDGFDSRGVDLILENERRGIYASTLIENFLATPLPEGALQEAYDAQFGNAVAEQEFNASHILVETEDEAKALVEELAAGGDFAALAKDKSKGPSGANGGQLGWFGKGQMVPPFEAATLALSDGEISAPVQTQFGWHVILLNEKREKPKPTLEDVQGKLMEQLQKDRLDAHMNGIREGVEVKRVEIKIPPEEIRNMGLIGQ